MLCSSISDIFSFAHQKPEETRERNPRQTFLLFVRSVVAVDQIHAFAILRVHCVTRKDSIRICEIPISFCGWIDSWNHFIDENRLQNARDCVRVITACVRDVVRCRVNRMEANDFYLNANNKPLPVCFTLAECVYRMHVSTSSSFQSMVCCDQRKQ